MTSLIVQDGSESAVVERTPLLVTYDPKAIGQGVDAAIAAKWAYDIPQGIGAGIEGAQEGQRLLASMGEVIQLDFVEIEAETADTSYWKAGATRWILNPDDPTQRIFGGNTIIHKEQPKYEKHNEEWMRRHPGQPELYLNPHWRAIGSSKAARNAILDLTPGNVRAAIVKAGLTAQQQLRQGSRGPQRQPEASTPGAATAAAAPPATARVTTDEQEAKATALIERYSREQKSGGLTQVLANAKEAWPGAVNPQTGRFNYRMLPDASTVDEFLTMLETGLEAAPTGDVA